MSSNANKYPNGVCQRRKHNGDPCESPALPDKRFCHYHHIMGEPSIDRDSAEPFASEHNYLPRLADADCIQAAISEVCELMLHRRIEPKEASSLFYAMQVASLNLAQVADARKQLPVSNGSTDNTDASAAPGTIQASAEPPQLQPESANTNHRKSGNAKKRNPCGADTPVRQLRAPNTPQPRGI